MTLHVYCASPVFYPTLTFTAVFLHFAVYSSRVFSACCLCCCWSFAESRIDGRTWPGTTDDIGTETRWQEAVAKKTGVDCAPGVSTVSWVGTRCTLTKSSYRQKCSISYRPITLVGTSRMRAILIGRVFDSLYCSFTPLSPTVHISRSRSCSIPWWYYNYLSFFSLTSFSKSFFIVLLPLIQFNVNFRDYLYM